GLASSSTYETSPVTTACTVQLSSAEGRGSPMANWQRPQMQRQALPQHASERIQRMRGAQGQRFFTSDLSVKEFLLTREAGFECAGLVMGSSIYHVGYQRGSYSQNQELVVLTQALY